MNTIQNELYHHGIAGMKWGRRNGPPYPLKPSAMSSSEKKGSLSNNQNKSSKTESTTSPSEKKRGLSDNQKKALKTAAAIGLTAAAGVAAYKLHKAGITKNAARLARVQSKSDDQLDKDISRLSKEIKYLNLEMDLENTMATRGRDTVNKVLDSIGSKALGPLAVGLSAYGLKQLLTKNTKLSEQDINFITRTMNEKKK